MSTPATMPMFSPDGTLGDVPMDKALAAKAAGAKPAVLFQSPDGKQGYVPADRIQDAVKAGGKILPYEQQEVQHPGFWHEVASDLAGMVKGLPSAVEMLAPPTPTAQGVGVSDLPQGPGPAPEGSSMAYRAARVPASIVANVPGMEKSAAQGDIGGVLGHAAATPVAMALTAGAAKAIPEAIDAGRASVENMRTSAVRATEPTAAALPPRAAMGVEQIYRAAAPVGSDPEFRGNLNAAAGDLAEIGRKTNIAESKGGVIQPDMRVRATRNAINDHLQQMYQNERAPQIARNADAPVVMKLSPDAQEGLQYLAKNAGTHADRALASQGLSEQAIPLGAVDELARATNRELAPLRGSTPQELALTEGTSRRFASLQALDKDLSGKIATELQNRGEGGISAYERRYAALSQIRDQLQKRMNMAELQRNTPVTKTINFLRRPSIAGASQAATANVNLGRMLQVGLKQLAESGIQPERAVGSGAPAVKGLLGQGNIELPSGMGSASTEPEGVFPAKSVVVRDPRTGRMRRMYVTTPNTSQ